MATTERVVDVLERVARRLQEEAGNKTISRDDIRAQVAAECGCELDSVIPSDYCYNRTNDGVRPSWPIFLELVGDGEFRFLGRDYPYNGPRWHHPKRGAPRQVGVWVNGILTEAAG